MFKIGRVSRDPETLSTQRNISVLDSTRLINPRKGNNLHKGQPRVLSEPNEGRVHYKNMNTGLGLEMHQNMQRVDKKINMKKHDQLPSLCNIRLALSSQVNKLGDNSHVRLIQELRGNRNVKSIREFKTMLAENSTKLLANKIGLRKALYLCAKRNSETQELNRSESSPNIELVGKNFNNSKLGEDLDYIREIMDYENRLQYLDSDENRYQHIDPFTQNTQNISKIEESPKILNKQIPDNNPNSSPSDTETFANGFFSTELNKNKKQNQAINVQEDIEAWKEESEEEADSRYRRGYFEQNSKDNQQRQSSFNKRLKLEEITGRKKAVLVLIPSVEPKGYNQNKVFYPLLTINLKICLEFWKAPGDCERNRRDE